MIHENIELTGSFTISGSFVLPSHPSTSSIAEETGSLYHDSVEGVLKVYTGTQWVTVGEQSGPPRSPYNIDYLVVAGGGGTGYGNNVIGAGAGGLLESSVTLTPSQTYTMTVGAGGTGPGAATIGDGTNGQNSSLVGSSVSITAIGGGRSNGQADVNGADGGSGGGGGKGGSSIGSPGQGTPGQGNDGAGNDGDAVGGSGGGAGGAGSSSGEYGSTPGGLGLASSITGNSVTYASGGGSYDRIGASNTGDGAGNGASAGGAGGFNGGSGVVILRMLTSNYSGTTTGSPTVTTDGDHTILTYTQSGTYTA